MKPDKVYENSIDKWRIKPNGIIAYSEELDLYIPLIIAIEKLLSKNSSSKVLVVLPYEEHLDILTTRLVSTKIFTHFDSIGKNLTIINATDAYMYINVEFTLIILYKLEFLLDSIEILESISELTSKFKLILTNDSSISSITKLPVVDNVSKFDVISKQISNEVIEYRYGIEFDEKNKELYDYYKEYIKDTITVFGDFDNIINCYSGKGTVSSRQFREELAESRGWSKDMDLSIDYYQKIDQFYNPTALYERAKQFHAIRTEMNKLIYSNTHKTNVVLSILNKFKDKKVLIISNQSIYAIELTEAINKSIKINDDGLLLSDIPMKPIYAVDFNVNVESREIIDPLTNSVITQKDGKAKKFGAKSINMFSIEMLKRGMAKVVSSHDSIPKYGNFTIDMLIYTSSECRPLNELKYRIELLKFVGNPRIITLYMKGTKEDDKLIYNNAISTNTIENISSIDEIIL